MSDGASMCLIMCFSVENFRHGCFIFNRRIVISDIPAKAYEYVVYGKSAIEWVMERYQVTVHKASGIKKTMRTIGWIKSAIRDLSWINC